MVAPGRRGCNALWEPKEKHGRAMPQRSVVRDQESGKRGGKGRSPQCSFGYMKGLLLEEKPLERAGAVNQKHAPTPHSPPVPLHSSLGGRKRAGGR